MVNSWNKFALGLILYTNGRWLRTQNCLSQYGNNALNRLFGIFLNVNLSITEKCKLYDSPVSSLFLNYGCELLGFVHSNELESIHTLLGIKKSTHFSVLYGELGRFSLYVYHKIRMLNYWVKILKNKDSLVFKIYVM